MTAPASDALPLQHRLDEARRLHERWIAAFIMALCATTIVGTRMAPEEFAGVRVLVGGLAFLVGLYYAYAWWASRCHAPSRPSTWLRTTLEVSVPTAVILIDYRSATALFALTSAADMAYPMAVIVALLRLNPKLPLYAGLLGAVQFYVVSHFLIATGDPDVEKLHPFFSGIRATFIICAGVLGMHISRRLRRLLTDLTREAEERERIRGAFGAYAPEAFVERLLSGELSVAPVRREISVLFLDIRDFTSLSERLDPADLLPRLNGALEAFSDAVVTEGGIVNKYLGDGLMALFNAPEPHADHRRRAIAAAVRIAGIADEMVRDGRFPELRVGVGVHSGEAVVGDTGGGCHREYTALGDVVNVASRVESSTKLLGVSVLVTAEAAAGLEGDFTFRPQSPLKVKGRDAPLTVFAVEVGGTTGDASAEPAPVTAA